MAITGFIFLTVIAGSVYRDTQIIHPLPLFMNICGDGICPDEERFSKNCGKDCSRILTFRAYLLGSIISYGSMSLSRTDAIINYLTIYSIIHP